MPPGSVHNAMIKLLTVISSCSLMSQHRLNTFLLMSPELKQIRSTYSNPSDSPCK